MTTTNVTSTQVKDEIRDRAEQNVLACLADGLPHIWLAGESGAKAARRLARRGIVRIEVLSDRSIAVRLARRV